jgi:hypothetical protein
MLRATRKIAEMNRCCNKAQWIGVLALALCAAASSAIGETKNSAPSAPITLAVLDFDYYDTSGEPRNQTKEHETLLQNFMQSLRRDLGRSGTYKVIALDCGPEPCTIKAFTPDDLFEAARKAGARLVLYGGIHKMSTLVQWARMQVIDVEKNVLVDDRHLSFRGDNEESWKRAEAFVTKQLEQHGPLQ